MPRPIHFEIHAEQPDRARAFYEALFGWSFTRWGEGGPTEYWLVKTGEPGTPGIDGGMLRRMGPPPTSGQAVNAFICTVDVPALDPAVTKAVGMGGAVVLPKMPIPGVGWLAYVTDTEGNIFGMMENDPNAK